MSPAASLPSPPSVLSGLQTNRSEGRVINQPCLLLCHLSLCREGGGAEGGSATSTALSPPPPLVPPWSHPGSGSLCRKGVAGLVTRTPASSANKGCSVRGAAASCCRASGSGPRHPVRTPPGINAPSSSLPSSTCQSHVC